MKIVGFNLSKILVQREEKLEGKLEVTQNINIKDLVEEDLPISSEKALKLKFNFSIKYSKGLADVEFEGFLVLVPSKEELTQFQEAWKDKKVPDQAKTSLFNFIMEKCNIKALGLEDEVNLPLHIPLPRLTPKTQQETPKK